MEIIKIIQGSLKMDIGLDRGDPEIIAEYGCSENGCPRCERQFHYGSDVREMRLFPEDMTLSELEITAYPGPEPYFWGLVVCRKTNWRFIVLASSDGIESMFALNPKKELEWSYSGMFSSVGPFWKDATRTSWPPENLPAEILAEI